MTRTSMQGQRQPVAPLLPSRLPNIVNQVVDPVAERDPDEEWHDMILAQGQSAGKGWDAVMRFARGERELEADPKIAILARHRRAPSPMRQPLLASRDLPSPIMGSVATPPPGQAVVTLKLAQPLASPHSPEPISDAAIASMVADLPPLRDRARHPHVHGCADDVADQRPQTALDALTALIKFAHQTYGNDVIALSPEPAEAIASVAPAILMLPGPAPKPDRSVDDMLTDALATLRALSSQRKG